MRSVTDLESLASSEALIDKADHVPYTEGGKRKKFDGYHFYGSHFHAILFRRLISIKRSCRMITATFTMTLFFTFLAVIAHYLMSSLITEIDTDMNFKFLSDYGKEILIAADDETEQHLPYLNTLSEIYREETGMDPRYVNFTTREELNQYMYAQAEKSPKNKPIVTMGVVFNNYYPMINMTVLHNTSQLTELELGARVQVTRMVWKTLMGKGADFKFKVTELERYFVELIYAQLGPFVTTVGLISIIPLFITQPITDIRGEVRDYMVSSTLSLLPYWLATFIVDLVIWWVCVIIVWVLFIVCKIRAFLDNKATTIYLLIAIGPSFVLFTYCISFMFSSAESAPRQLFVILCVVMCIPVIVDFSRYTFVDPVWLDWIYGLFPHILLQRALAQMCLHISFLKEDYKYYWTTNKNVQAFYIMEIVDIPIYCFLLWLIETLRIKLGRKDAQSTYNSYIQFFKDQKMRHPVTKEARELEKIVESGVPLAVAVKNVSRLYFNTEGIPISAVNNVTLGVKEGALFGFLGANGAGKTTLIKMITAMIPPSNGVIEILGQDLAKNHDPTLLSICPQFNTHLCFEMTVREHFYMYCLIHRLDQKQAERTAAHLIQMLDLTKFVDKPVRELSGGNARKLAIALSFYAPSSIILLDEPTSSLDPVARHNVHELIQSYRGQRTFMLCTHLLSEAEALCDVISIMIKGCVYTYGTPQYLSQKFGTEFKIDVLLDDDSEETAIKCDNFFANTLPLAEMTISRPKARIYSIPASMITLADLFEKMGEGKSGDNGFGYYTCSSSSLERVFMEIVRISEQADEDGTHIMSSTLLSSHSEAGGRPLPNAFFDPLNA
ncbi:ABC transporter family protein [Tritrichomonas foetus]|uniref:ABC transporter family protein n=1 Tax=Tritrichomonas foetus TaxID=1144522 RepID=A0A1J4JD20_9EUKA|nr:ABC transporter family protein [Tritrichomonas foetus]|eukprot:OHS95172.1 ABC transporter family protein [Tritrichomonas foetus]